MRYGRGRAREDEPKEEAERLAERKFKKHVILRVVPEETPYKKLTSNLRSSCDSNMIERLNKPPPLFLNSIANALRPPLPLRVLPPPPHLPPTSSNLESRNVGTVPDSHVPLQWLNNQITEAMIR